MKFQIAFIVLQIIAESMAQYPSDKFSKNTIRIFLFVKYYVYIKTH